MEYAIENTNVVSSEQFLASDPAKDTLQWKMDAGQDKTKKASIIKYYI